MSSMQDFIYAVEYIFHKDTFNLKICWENLKFKWVKIYVLQNTLCVRFCFISLGTKLKTNSFLTSVRHFDKWPQQSTCSLLTRSLPSVTSQTCTDAEPCVYERSAAAEPYDRRDWKLQTTVD